jgi:hypothetical protein
LLGVVPEAGEDGVAGVDGAAGVDDVLGVAGVALVSVFVAVLVAGGVVLDFDDEASVL